MTIEHLEEPMDTLTEMLHRYEAALAVVQKRQARLIAAGLRRNFLARRLNQIAIALYSFSVRTLKQTINKRT